MDAAAKPRRSIAWPRLNDCGIGDATDRGERLQTVASLVVVTRRVNGVTIAAAHALERSGLAAIHFHKAGGNCCVCVCSRNDANPIVACVHVTSIGRSGMWRA